MFTLKFFHYFLFTAALLFGSFPFILGYDANNSTAADSSGDSNPTQPQCGSGNGVNENYDFSLHVGALFIILATSSFGAFIPVVAKKYPVFRIHEAAFFVAKHFGTGVILATAFIHMLPSAFGALGDPCLPLVWTTYSAFPGAFAMAAALIIFFFEYIAIKVTEEHEERLRTTLPSSNQEVKDTTANSIVEDHTHHAGHSHGHIVMLTSRVQTLGIVILEVGICFHSVIIGMALSVSTGSDFISLLCALVFHQMFEGLGLGSRIAELSFPDYSWKPWLMSLAYGTTTPVGIAIGLGVRYSYDPQSQTALLVQGVFDSVSAGILLYAGMVELLAADFIMSTELRRSRTFVQVSAFVLILLGGGLMALIGRWA